MKLHDFFPALLLTCVSMCGQADAGVIFSQDLDVNANSWPSAQGFEQEMDNISIAGSSAWANVGWYGSYSTVSADDFAIRLFADVAGTPGVNPMIEENVGAVTRTSTGLTSARGFEVFEYSAAVNNFTGIAAGDYHFSIVNGLGSNWLWNGSGVGPGGHFRSNDGDTWIPHSTPTDFAFSISASAVPEPGSTAILLGCLVPAFLRRRRKV